MKRKRLSLLISVFSFMVLVGTSNADDHTPPPLAEAWAMTVKLGHMAEFKAGLKAHMTMRTEAGDPRVWHAYSPVTGDQLDTVIVRTCCYNWADQDSYEAWDGQTTTAEHWNANVHPHVATYQHRFDRIHHASNNWPENRDPNYVGVTTFYIKEGADGSLAAAMAEISAIAKEKGWGRQWSWMTAETGTSRLMLVSPFDNYADMEPPEKDFYEFLTDAIGSEKDAIAMLDNFSSYISHSDYTIYKKEVDLSMSDTEQ